MSKENIKDLEKQQQENAAARVSRVETFFNNYKKTIWSVLGVIVVIGLGVLCYQKFYAQPKQAEAHAQMFPAESNFRAQQYELALNGDGNVLGFAQIIDEYGSHAGAAVYFYAGVCELQLGNYENAISYLKKYNGKDAILTARALACEGDALVNLDKAKEGLACYEKAAAKADNIYAAGYLLKAGVICEELGESEKALGFYKKIKDQYPQSMEGYDIDKYISRIESAK